MTTFNCGKITFSTKTEMKLSGEEIKTKKEGEITEYALKLVLEDEASPMPYKITWREGQIDMLGFWSSTTGFNMRNIRPDWSKRTEKSRVASGMPLISVFSKSSKNRATITLSDAYTPCALRVGAVEETGELEFEIELFCDPCSKIKEYELTIRIDRRDVYLFEAIKNSRLWWSELGYKETYVPSGAKDPLYSAWYSFHQNTYPEPIIETCKQAKALGMDTLIVDDGWQTDDSNRGYAFCGDWEICESKIPSMQYFVDEIHKLDMKFMIWFSVPFVGEKSKNFERFKGKYLSRRESAQACVLDPRFKEVRDFLVDTYASYVQKYGWDGLKLDFIDSFELDEKMEYDYENMDTVSVEEGVERLLCEVCDRLKSINPEFLIEFRQSYVGPVVGQYGNMLRVTDCPNDALYNRVGGLDLRLTSGKIAVHSDMLMWNENDTNESVMYQLLATLMCVPQISVRFDKVTPEHKRLLKGYLDFWREHRDTILDGELEAYDMEAGYSLARSKKDGESVAVLYQGVVLKYEGDTAYVYNSTGHDGIYVESPYDVEYELYDIFGEKRCEGKEKKGIFKLELKSCERARIKRR